MYAKPLPDNAVRARNAAALMMVCMGLFAVITLVSLLKLFSEELFFDNIEFFTFGEAALAIIRFVLVIVTAVFFIMWFRRAYNNLHILQARGLPFSEGWAAGGWFVPIIHLHYPYRIMNSIWTETQECLRKTGENYERQTDGYIGWWWTFWITGNIVSNIQSQIVLRNPVVSVYDQSMIAMEVISESALFLAAWLCWRMIRRTAVMESELQERYAEWQAFQTQQYAQQYQSQQTTL
jgi:hypothetical protein